MPYRRLPNTDASRLRAMRTALEKGKDMSPLTLAFSPKTVIRLEKFLPQFEHNIHLYRITMTTHNKKNREYYESVKKARIYVTHFIRVMNMAIYRGELPSETRAYYGLATNESAAPLLNTEDELLNWGRRIIEGEESRIKNGGSPITNPTIAVVKVRFGNFLDALNQNQTMAWKMAEHTEKINALRKEADDIILSVWNDVEKSYQSYPEDVRKTMCENYGLVYFYRKSEIEKIKAAGSPENQED